MSEMKWTLENFETPSQMFPQMFLSLYIFKYKSDLEDSTGLFER